MSLYSYSFAPNNSCAKVYASRDEVLQYISNVAKTFDVNTKFRGKTSCVGAIWQEATSTWELELEHTETKHRYRQQCQILISAVGAFVDPAPCNIPGIEDFQGEVVHTARWKNIELNNKNVVVVGNGGMRKNKTAMQCNAHRLIWWYSIRCSGYTSDRWRGQIAFTIQSCKFLLSPRIK